MFDLPPMRRIRGRRSSKSTFRLSQKNSRAVNGDPSGSWTELQNQGRQILMNFKMNRDSLNNLEYSLQLRA
eukprot:2950481-Amphidinium_carterae.5